jgi:DNA-binding protein YbaB
MEQWERDQIRSQNDDLKGMLAQVEGEFDNELAEMGEVNRKLAKMTVRATSPNNLARVTVNATGMVTDITVAEDAYRRSTPQQLSQDINAAIRGAMEAAAKAREQVVAPMKSIVDAMPDFGDVVPGAPNVRDVRAWMSERQEPRPPRG